MVRSYLGYRRFPLSYGLVLSHSILAIIELDNFFNLSIIICSSHIFDINYSLIFRVFYWTLLKSLWLFIFHVLSPSSDMLSYLERTSKLVLSVEINLFGFLCFLLCFFSSHST